MYCSFRSCGETIAGRQGAMAVAVLIKSALNVVLPPRCPTCGEMVDDDLQFCGACWGNLHFISDPACTLCGRPFTEDRSAGALCGPCLGQPPAFDGLKAVVVYDDLSRQIALKLKYGGRIGLAKLIARYLERHLVEAGPEHLLVAVPLHRWRIWRRGFNQSHLIARILAQRCGVELADDALQRVRATPPLKGLTARQRAEIVRSVFAIGPRWAGKIRGRHIFLVDDVFTTGATANACVRLLKKAGASSVTILCWARVLREGEEGAG